MKTISAIPLILILTLTAITLWGMEPAADCPCSGSITRMAKAYQEDAVFKLLIDMAFAHMQQVPEHYRTGGNPWIGKNFNDLLIFFQQWCDFLPQAQGSSDNGLYYIEQMDLFAYKNPYGRAAFQTKPGIDLFRAFAGERGAFLDSPASTKYVAEWLANPRTEKEDYLLPDPDAPDGGFTSYNTFFSRGLKHPQKVRPQTMPERDYIISAPTDALMNSIPAHIVDAKTKIRTKGTQELNIELLLAGSKHWSRFIGGTALSCILMPNTYHRYHAPVSGDVIETRLVSGALLGMKDFPSFVPPGGNVGYYGSDFNAFEAYQRGYFIIDTGAYGLVAVVPVGLSTVGSVVFKEKYLNATGPMPIARGDELGHFLYGGSLVILVFEPGMYRSDAIKVRLGNQIGTLDTKSNK